MTAYKNLSGSTGVVAYELGEDFIKVRFRHSPKVYVYDGSQPGPSQVQRMKELAQLGRGLSTYVSRVVQTNYARIEEPSRRTPRRRTTSRR